MHRRRAIMAVMFALALPGTGASTANDVIADYFGDGQLDSVHSVEDLRAALMIAQERTGDGPQYSAFADVVSEAITQDIAGTSSAARDQLSAQRPKAAGDVSAGPDPTAGPPEAASDLPTPPTPDPNEALPVAVPIMGVVALGLVATGSVAGLLRRRRRRRPPPSP